MYSANTPQPYKEKMSTFFRAIYNIFKYIGKFFTFLRNLFLNIFFIGLLLVVVFSLFPVEPKDIPTLPSNAVLQLVISGKIVEQKRILGSFERFFDDSFLDETKEPETGLQDILDIIDTAAKDDNIKVLLLNLKNMGKAGLNQLATIGEALNRFKLSGKPVIAAEDFYTQSQYFLASYATTVVLNPMGAVDIHGMGVYNLYFREAIDRLKVNCNVFKVGSYKSALEPFTRTNMSAEDKRQNQIWLSALWKIYTEKVNENRDLEADQLQRYTNNINESLSAAHGDTSQLAINSGLVDHAWTREQIRSHLSTLSHSSSLKPRIISSSRYYKHVKPSFIQTDANEVVGIIIAEGPILPGKHPPGVIGSKSLAHQIREARNNKKIKALVLRINTGGGSAFASEIIRQEILEYKKSGKPLVVSMGTIAASGGYWVAANADEIWAQDSTITGSIGIFGAIPTFEESLASLGVYSDGIGTTPLAAGLNIAQPLPPSLKAAIQQTVEFSYEKFLKIVSSGRQISPRKVAEIAKGRIYDGETAKNIGLIDKIGGLQQATDSAADLAKLTAPSAQYIQPPRSLKDQILNFLTSKIQLKVSTPEFPEISKARTAITEFLKPFLLLNDPQGIYAYCPVNPKF